MKKSQCAILLVFVFFCSVPLHSQARPADTVFKPYPATAYKLDPGIIAPNLIESPDPTYSEEARKARLQGLVVLKIVVDTEGKTKDIKVLRSLGGGLDEKAIEAVRKWRFTPAKKNGVPVAVMVTVKVAFHLDK